ncbi:hypothetical protein SUNI508_04479 [Seiridium unicorne]|uniref:Histidine kinase n=1 Tax=Seiridium unicorne TaxID=138068 RepID=A0ABR2V8E6_9PEZI
MSPFEHTDLTPLSLLADYLDAEPRPSFVSHLSDSKADLLLDYANLALRSHAFTYNRVKNGHGQRNSAPPELVSQLAGDENQRIAPQVGWTVSFNGIRWSPTIVGGRWVVMTTTDEVSLLDELKSPEPANGQSDTIEHTNHNSPPGDVSLGAVYPQGYLGDLEHLEWLRQFDWTSSSCGPIETWPDELRQACEMALAMPDPVCIMWGSDLTLIYNKPWSAIAGERHPRALGRPYVENWREVHSVYVKLFGTMKHTGQSAKQESVSRILTRNGYPEQIYANLTFAPLLAKNRSVVGIWVATHETTRQVLSEKRIRILTDLGNDLAHLTALPDLWTSLVNMLERCKDDFEFAAVYGTDSLLDKSTKIALHAVMGMSESGDRHPDLDAAIRTALTTGAATWLSTASNNLSEGLAEYFRTHGVQGACREFILQPVRCNIDDDIVAVILVGIYPFRKYDQDLQSFMQLLTRQVESSTTVIRNLEKEKARLEHEFITKMDKRFWNFAEKAPIGIYTYDQEGSMTYCNKAFEDLVGAPRAALSRPMGWTGVVHPDSLEHINSIWEKLVEKQEYPATFDVQFTKAWAPRGKDQFLDRTWCLANSYPEITDQGEVKGVIGCAMDVSSLKWAESIQSERLSEALELKRQQGTFFDVMSHELRNPLGAIIHSAYELLDQLTEFNAAPGPKDDELLKNLLEMATTIVYCGNHQKRILDDVLTLSKLDSKLIQIFPISTNPAKLLKEVVAIFSAELRNSGIGLEIKLGAGYRMLDIDAVMIDPHRVTQVIVNLLSNAIKFIKDEPQRNISLSVDAFMTDQEQDPRVRYVSSGTYHRDPTSDVEWGVGTPFYLSFSVQDTGLGMTEEESNRLFKQFSQASPRTHAQYGGSGLGLFISRELTELHGGRIGLWSERGAGSLFSFYVKARLDITRQTIGSPIIKAASYPRIQELNLSTPTFEDPTKGSLISSQELPNAREPPASSDTGAAIKRVLLVEDNIINQRLLKKLLIKHNYDVTVANNGQEALEMVQGSKWNTTLQGADRPQLDIVLSDIEMPIMDGKACIRRIRQLQREGMLQQDIPVLAVTGNAQREKVQEFQDCGFDAVITKPYDIPKLLRIIHEYSTKYDSFS